MMAHSVVDFNLHIPVNSLLMAFVFGVLANPGREMAIPGAGSTGSRTAVDYLPRLALPALGIWLAVAGLPLLPGEYYAEEARKALRDGHALVGLNFASEGLKRESRNPMLFYYLGEARQAMADSIPNPEVSRSFREAAIEPYQAGVKLFPTDMRLLLRLGAALTLTERFDEAEPLLRQAIEWDPLFPTTHSYYGSYLLRRGRVKEAEAAFRDAIKIAPEATASESLKRISDASARGSLNN